MGHEDRMGSPVSCGDAKVDELGILERQTQPSSASQGQEVGCFFVPDC